MAQGTDRLDTETPAEIERDIAHTRAEMTETIDALGARFEPSYLKEQAQEAITDTARSAGTSMVDTIKDNPLPAGIAALSIAWLFANRTSGHAAPRRSTVGARTGRPYASGYPSYAATGMYAGNDTEPGLADKASGAAAQARDKAGDLVDRASASASDLADQARHTAQDLGQQTQQMASRAESWLEGQMQQNPLGVGAVALAAGALVGLSLPETQVEMNLMGEQAGRVMDQAKQVAGQTLDQAKEVASKVADEARDKASDLAKTATDEAKAVAQTAKSEARDVADDARERASDAADKATNSDRSATEPFGVPGVKRS